MDFAFFRTLAGQRLEGSQTLLPLAGLCLRQMHANCRTPKGYGCSGGSHLGYTINYLQLIGKINILAKIYLKIIIPTHSYLLPTFEKSYVKKLKVYNISFKNKL